MRSFRPSAAIAIALLALTACTHKPVTPQFETLSVDTLIGASPNGCRIEYHFESIANAEKSPALQAIEAANIGHFFELEEFTGTAHEAVQQAIGELRAELALPGGLSDGEVSVEAETLVQDTTLTYTITRYSFTGGAHGIYGTYSYNYSLNSGAQIALADLLDSEARAALDALIRTQLYEQYDAQSDKELSTLGFFPECIATTENFRLTPTELTLFYNPYEIGCYALGGIEVAIPREELAKLNPALAPANVAKH